MKKIKAMVLGPNERLPEKVAFEEDFILRLTKKHMLKIVKCRYRLEEE